VVRAGLVWTQVNARVETGDPVLPSVRQLTAGAHAGFMLDQLDHAWFAQAGYRVNASIYSATKALGSALNYQKFAADGTYVVSWGSNSVLLHAEGGTDFGSGMPPYESFTLGGPLRLSAFRLDQFAGHEFAFARAMYYRRIFALPDLLGTGVYLGGSAEVGMMRDRFQQMPIPPTLFSASVFLGADTFAGPAYLGAGVGNNGAVSAYLLLGAP
jgi:NTE family protein